MSRRSREPSAESECEGLRLCQPEFTGDTPSSARMWMQELTRPTVYTNYLATFSWGYYHWSPRTPTSCVWFIIKLAEERGQWTLICNYLAIFFATCISVWHTSVLFCITLFIPVLLEGACRYCHCTVASVIFLNMWMQLNAMNQSTFVTSHLFWSTIQSPHNGL